MNYDKPTHLAAQREACPYLYAPREHRSSVPFAQDHERLPMLRETLYSIIAIVAGVVLFAVFGSEFGLLQGGFDKP